MPELRGRAGGDDDSERDDKPWYIPADTTPEAYEVQNEAYRRMGGTGRSQVMFRLTDMARRNSMAGIRERHPDYDAEQVKRAYFRLVHGDELAREVWPDDELLDP